VQPTFAPEEDVLEKSDPTHPANTADAPIMRIATGSRKGPNMIATGTSPP
jgi:hypothetical protein